MDAWVRSQASPREICDEQKVNGTGFSPSISGFPCISPMVHHHILINHNTCYIILATDIIIKQNISLFCLPNTRETQSDTRPWTVEIWQPGLRLV